MTYSEKIVKLRKANGYSQETFAKLVGVSRQAVYKWEAGQSYPEAEKLIEIKKLFGIKIDDLLDDSYEVVIEKKPAKKKEKKAEKPAEEVKEAPVEEVPAAEAPAEEAKEAPAEEKKEESPEAPAKEETPAPAEEKKTEEKPAEEKAHKPQPQPQQKNGGFLGFLFGRNRK